MKSTAKAHLTEFFLFLIKNNAPLRKKTLVLSHESRAGEEGVCCPLVLSLGLNNPVSLAREQKNGKFTLFVPRRQAQMLSVRLCQRGTCGAETRTQLQHLHGGPPA